MSARGCLLAVAVTSTMVSPMRTDTAPPASMASLPVEMTTSCSPSLAVYTFSSIVLSPENEFGCSLQTTDEPVRRHIASEARDWKLDPTGACSIYWKNGLDALSNSCTSEVFGYSGLAHLLCSNKKRAEGKLAPPLVFSFDPY